MPVLQFKGKTAIESHHHTVPHHNGNLIIEGDNLWVHRDDLAKYEIETKRSGRCWYRLV